jgi:hypothetical protein
MKPARRFLAGLAALAAVALAGVAGTSWYYGGADGAGCARCHEIRPMVESWAASSHRTVACKECHGSSFGADLRMHAKSLQRAWLHARGEAPEQIHVRHTDVVAIVARCASCHREEHADWESGPHGAPYAAIFINPEHNAGQQLIDDCLRCHAMHFDGGIGELVTPLDRKGPWTFVHEQDAGLPAVPCLACHAVHRTGQPFASRTARGKLEGREQELVRPSLAFYDRRALEPVGLERLPLPTMWEGARPVRTSPDQRQALCCQCHAPARGRSGLLGRRPHAGRRPRGPELPLLSRQARSHDARFLRRLSSASLELRDRGRDDGHALQVEAEPVRRPPRGLQGLPSRGGAAEDEGGGGPLISTWCGGRRRRLR